MCSSVEMLRVLVRASLYMYTATRTEATRTCYKDEKGEAPHLQVR